MAVRIETRIVDGVTVMACAGQITLGESSTRFRNTFRELLQSGMRRLVLDLGEITFLDSTGIGELVGAYTSAQNAGASLKLARVPGKVEELLRITKLDTVFESFHDQAKAVGSFSD
jgi:anti-sigma B factor antagonist